MKERYVEIAQELINNSYTEIRGKRILIILVRFRYYAFSVWIPPVLRIIGISRRAKSLNEKALVGLLAHELSHQVRFLKMGFNGYILFICKYIFSEKEREKEEKSTDRLTIEKGYARELSALSVITGEDKMHKPIQGNYLTPSEIRTYAESIGRW